MANLNSMSSFLLLARGGGKNGFMSSRDAFLSAHYIQFEIMMWLSQPIPKSKERFHSRKFMKLFSEEDWKIILFNKMSITGRANNSVFSYRTNNPKTMDSARDGCLEFWWNSPSLKMILLLKSSDQDLVRLLTLAPSITVPMDTSVKGFTTRWLRNQWKSWMENLRNFSLFPFICKLDDPEEVDDMSNWPKANPYAWWNNSLMPNVYWLGTKADYDDLGLEPSGRHGIYDQADESARSRHRKDVTTREKLMAALQKPWHRSLRKILCCWFWLRKHQRLCQRWSAL